MATKSPAFQWYPKDILTSERVLEMTLAEEGAYRRLIDFCWLNGSVPADPARAARIIGKGCSVEIAKTVLKMFTPDPNNGERMIHDRLEEEREKQNERRQKTSDAAHARWEKERQGTAPTGGEQASSDANSKASPKKPGYDCNADAMQMHMQTHMRMQCSSSPSSSSDNTKEKNIKKESPEETEKPKPKTGFDIFGALPAEFSESGEFCRTWEEWLAYRRERKLPKWTASTLKIRATQFAEWGVAQTISNIRNSIANSWQGIFEKRTENGTHKRPSKPDRNAGTFNDPGDYDLEF